MFRSLIALAIAGALAGCGQQAMTPSHAATPTDATSVDVVPATLAHAEAPEGWAVSDTAVAAAQGSARVVVENGHEITELPAVQMVFVRGNRVAMQGSKARDMQDL